MYIWSRVRVCASSARGRGVGSVYSNIIKAVSLVMMYCQESFRKTGDLSIGNVDCLCD